MRRGWVSLACAVQLLKVRADRPALEPCRSRVFCYSWLRQLLLDPRGLVGVLFLGLRRQSICLLCLNLQRIRLLLCPPWNGCSIVSTVIALGGVCQYVFSTHAEYPSTDAL